MPTQLLCDLLAQLAVPFSGEALFDCLSDVVFFIKNDAGQYVAVNHTLVQRCGLRGKADLIGRRPQEVFPPPLGLSYRDQDQAILRDGSPILDQLELQLYPHGETGWCLTNKLPLYNGSGRVVGVAGISRDLHVRHDEGDDYAQLAAAIRRIRESYHQPLKVRQLAADAGLSEYQFEQRIRRIFQITPGQLLQKVRMEAAVRYLATTGTPIAQIALDCGYADQSSFSRQFKQTVGLSPAEYRRATNASSPQGS